MGSKLQAGGVSIDTASISGGVGLAFNGFETLAISGVGHSQLSSLDINCYQISGSYASGFARPTTNSVYPRFTPVDYSGNVVPYALSTQWQYASSYGDTGQQNLTSAFNAGLQVYNTGKTNNIKFIVEGAGFAWTTYDTTPCVVVRSIYQYANWTVHRIDALTLGTGASSTNTDFNKIRLSFSSGTFYGGCTYRIFA